MIKPDRNAHSTRKRRATTHRAFRIPDDLYDASRAKAAQREETLTSVVCKALERYVRAK